MKIDPERLLSRAEALIDKLEGLLPPPPPPPDWNASVAFRWRKAGPLNLGGWLQPVRHVHQIRLADLQGIQGQIRKVEQNTRQAIYKVY